MALPQRGGGPSRRRRDGSPSSNCSDWHAVEACHHACAPDMGHARTITRPDRPRRPRQGGLPGPGPAPHGSRRFLLISLFKERVGPSGCIHAQVIYVIWQQGRGGAPRTTQWRRPPTMRAALLPCPTATPPWACARWCGRLVVRHAPSIP